MTSVIRPTEKKVETIDSLKIADSLKAGPLEDYGKFPGMPKHTPSLLEKRFLVWSGHYKSIKDVPNRVEHEQMSKSKNWARVRINIYMIGIAVVMSGVMMYLGKQDAKENITLEDINLAWHKKINEEHRRAQEEAAKKQ